MPKKSFYPTLFTFLLLLLTWTSSWAADEKPKKAPQKVYTGIYLMNVYDLDINGYSYYADFYLWFRWKGKLDPTKIEFVNSIEKWGSTQVMFHDSTKTLPDGYSYNGMRFEGRFYHSFELKDFPMDRHPLDIRIESIEYSKDSLIYLPDTSKTLLREGFNIPGWVIKDAKIVTHNNTYKTNFGEPTGPPTFSNFTFKLTIGRPLSYFLLKLLLPLLVMLMASLLGLFIHPDYIDARISLPIGGLLSCVFLQQSYSTALPDVGYMVLMDRIYLVAYVMIAIIMMRIIKGSNLLTKDHGRENVQKTWATDRRRGYQLMGFIVIAIFILVIIR
ncbi:hypothetical protein [Haliscomenobacter sp.]|uniref:hypothetical protein n=1 Tax=Haliscomenobacter sp. TaxID=2717303 RepID=UPI003364C167